MACCVISHLWLFWKGMLECLEKMLTILKWKLGLECKFFLSKTFQKFHIVIWSCMKLEDVLEVLPMLMLESFLGWFVFFGGREQCSKTFNFTWVPLLLKGFEMCLLWLLWERLWKGGINIVN
jgi:hypothetical protein